MALQNLGAPLEGFAEFTRKVAAEGAVLLKNENNVLPIKKGERVSVFGRTQFDYYRSGTGSGGSVNVVYTTNLLSGLRNHSSIHVNEDLAKNYEDWRKENPFDNGGGGWAAEPWHQKEMPLTEAIVSQAAAVSQKAIVAIGRTAGEDQDNAAVEGSYLLTSEEKEMLYQVAKYFSHIIVVLNVSNIIDMNWINETQLAQPVEAVLYAWHGGMEGGNAIADVLSGDVTPSGKLTDTIAYSIEDYPSTKNYGGELKNFYSEDIYVGYRYFETFCPQKVQFPFGFGLSYTEFEIKQQDVKIEEEKQQIAVRVRVKNIGNAYAGKEVVQIYVKAPQGKLGKPALELAAFQKTKLLAPQEEEQLTLYIPFYRFASYDDSGVTGHPYSYVLEEGSYQFLFGNQSKNVKPLELNQQMFTYTVKTCKVLETLQQAVAPTEAFSRIKPGKQKSDGTFEIQKEEVPLQQISLEDRIIDQLPKEITQTGDLGYKLQDVQEKRISMEEFIAQLDDEDLAAIVRGEGMCHPRVTPGTASAFGGVTDRLYKFGIMLACTSDGPSGIRMDGGHLATQVPIGTLLAATWDTNFVEELYVLEGKELRLNHIDMLLGPGMNIRRSPLNGRNFEYFSEDPLITGSFALAVTRGIQKGGAKATLKHFACNNQEKNRSNVDAICSERAIREIYIKGFEIAVKGGADGIMTSYNPINGHWAASNYDLNTTVLRKEWGYQGIVMTDWWAKMNDCVTGGEATPQNMSAMVRAQNDLYMVVTNFGAETNLYNDNTIQALKEHKLQRSELQRNAMNICNYMMQLPVFFDNHNKAETAEKIKAYPVTKENELAQNMNQNAYVQVENQKAGFVCEKAGTYRLFAEIMSMESELAQSSDSLYLNKILIATAQTNGNKGVWFSQKLGIVALEAGYYEVEVEKIKHGMQLRAIELKEI